MTLSVTGAIAYPPARRRVKTLDSKVETAGELHQIAGFMNTALLAYRFDAAGVAVAAFGGMILVLLLPYHAPGFEL
jgi:hypothetical protein